MIICLRLPHSKVLPSFGFETGPGYSFAGLVELVSARLGTKALNLLSVCSMTWLALACGFSSRMSVRFDSVVGVVLTTEVVVILLALLV